MASKNQRLATLPTAVTYLRSTERGQPGKYIANRFYVPADAETRLLGIRMAAPVASRATLSLYQLLLNALER
ncbi:hypothetical protein FF011L_53540 [Roseimaritima multifibrata]|uniref:Uncharacterized protein n=1 Tax=Roseimaritima multifibrata TaxID=1930274 RepID=A0A517MNT5_9BACT|nr:hypothetical protein [Roseimaritima multifibrata]QDS96542.1 hypothetical protein FF011L_53540 [Roseimaritima multifibrata]